MAADPITAGLDLAKTVVQTIWPDKSEQEKAQLAAAVQMVQSQLNINQAEATNPTLFVSGWRPFVGWVCGAACAWNWIGIKIALFVAALYGYKLELAPVDLAEMSPILMGMLGLGGLRTFEKINVVAAK